LLISARIEIIEISIRANTTPSYGDITFDDLELAMYQALVASVSDGSRAVD